MNRLDYIESNRPDKTCAAPKGALIYFQRFSQRSRAGLPYFTPVGGWEQLVKAFPRPSGEWHYYHLLLCHAVLNALPH
jgi:hypothetical protein